jgi:hypothetical protein
VQLPKPSAKVFSSQSRFRIRYPFEFAKGLRNGIPRPAPQTPRIRPPLQGSFEAIVRCKDIWVDGLQEGLIDEAPMSVDRSAPFALAVGNRKGVWWWGGVGTNDDNNTPRYLYPY